jgi:hypothetical protein
MKASTQNISAQSGTILAYAQHFVNVNVKTTLANTGLGAGVTLLPAGSIVDKTGKLIVAGSTDAQAFGVVYEDIDFKNTVGTENLSVVIHGFVKASAVPGTLTATMQSALKMIQFI